MNIKYFYTVTSFADLKKQNRKLAIANHPDKGGSTQAMQEVNAEFEQLFPLWENRTGDVSANTGYEHDYAGATAREYTGYVYNEYRCKAEFAEYENRRNSSTGRKKSNHAQKNLTVVFDIRTYSYAVVCRRKRLSDVVNQFPEFKSNSLQFRAAYFSRLGGLYMVWLSLDRQSGCLFNPESNTFTPFSDIPALKPFTKALSTTYIKHLDEFWITNYSRQIERFKKTAGKIKHLGNVFLDIHNTSYNVNVNAIAEDSFGNTLIGTEYELLIRNKNGQLNSVFNFQSALTDIELDKWGKVWVITEKNRIRLQNDLKIAKIEKQKSEELAQTKLRYFTNISHEFLTPLTIIDCAIDDAETTHKEKITQLETIRYNAERLKRLLQVL
jgi:curved DNA-binding protein CbpA